MASKLTTSKPRLNPNLARIRIYPFKSLSAIECAASTFTLSGSLTNDRRFALFDEHGKIISAKTTGKLHQLHLSGDPSQGVFHFQNRSTGAHHTFRTNDEFRKLEDWLGQQLLAQVTIQEADDIGFPDDRLSSGPTLISEATLQTVASWFPACDIEDIRERFRTNLEITGVPAFWEDRLFGASRATPVSFQIGKSTFHGTNPCQRCAVPSRDWRTGQPTPNFVSTFRQQRLENFPEWTVPEPFNHYYRLAVNTLGPTTEKQAQIQVGARLVITA